MSSNAISSNTLGDDIKAQFLSYIAWVYGISNISPESLGKWPTDLEGHCEFCRDGAGSFQSDNFLCINPFHYIEPELIAATEERIQDELRFCLKGHPNLAGEQGQHEGQTKGKSNDSEASKFSRCYCLVRQHQTSCGSHLSALDNN